MGSDNSGRPHERVTTGVPGLDRVLGGGLLRRGIYMLQGKPGAGKTILANQISFHQAAHDGQVLYVTLLAESHERLLFNLEELTFFDPEQLPDRMRFLSAFSVLEEKGLEGLTELLRREARARKVTLLVVDGLVSVSESAATRKHFKRFIHDLQIHANLVGCTVLLLTSTDEDPVGPEHTMVDGVLMLGESRWARRSEREIEVRKFRGSGHLRGGHSFRISDAGITIYPRLEELFRDPSREVPPVPGCRVTSGVAQLDQMLHGGLCAGSSTLLFGPSGSGKTTLGLEFLDASSKKEPGLLFGFYETPQRLLLKSRELGLSLDGKVRDGTLDLIWHAPTERILDALGARLLEAVKARGVKRLFVDGVDGFIQSASFSERIPGFLAALTNELRAEGVTTIFTSELPVFFGRDIELALRGVSILAENIVLVRFVEDHTRLRRMLAIVKVRDSEYDESLRELVISPKGIRLEPTFEGATSVVSGTARPRRRKAPPARGPAQKKPRR